ncbi:sugar transferase [Marivita sp. GX14005]|uniref:sugar transferase n=1 Tax=Marivita sp. GX14005 TaxID=2942276 RepID=UPI002019641B|nr:sugar transferase [Marivita sp. GX14005]MCL3881655.1 sugar transferase [Marivita sp. GX14005]
MSQRRYVIDALAALLLLVLLWPVIAACALLILMFDRHNPFFGAKRMNGPSRAFVMWKLRTMRGQDDGLPTGGNKSHLVTPLGRSLRRWRLDELPQLWNVVRGDMALVGPRPPTARMVARYPGAFRSLSAIRPGITGLATLRWAMREHRMLSRVGTAEELETLYATFILPRKLRIERLYTRRRSLALDLWICAQTLRLILSMGAVSPLPRSGWSPERHARYRTPNRHPPASARPLALRG